MFHPFKRRPKIQPWDVLFGDLPVSHWPSEASLARTQPWRSFVAARGYLAAGQVRRAVRVWQRILALPGLESQHYLQAWHFLRQAGIQPPAGRARDMYGVVVELDFGRGLDIVAAYADGRARYYHFSRAAVIWEVSDSSLHPLIDDVFRAGKVVADRIGPWEGARPSALPRRHARISVLTPSGVHLGQASFNTLSRDPLGGPVIAAATALMRALLAKTRETKPPQSPRTT